MGGDEIVMITILIVKPEERAGEKRGRG